MKKLLAILGICALPLTVGVGAHASTALPTNAMPADGAPHLMRIPSGRVQAATAPAGAHLTYLGGKVVSNVQVVQVLWGTGNYAPEVSATGIGSVPAMYRNVAQSSHLDWLTQYNTPTQTIGRGTYSGQFTIAPSITSPSFTVAQIQTELVAQIAAGQLPAPTTDAAGNTNTYYSVFFPHNIILTASGFRSCVAGGFFAYHSTVAATLSHPEFYFGAQADMQSGSGCEIKAPWTDANRIALETTVATHEMVETITDPEIALATTISAPLAWYDSTNGEIGDICNIQNGSIVGNDGQAYSVQPEFSNADNDCIVAPVTANPTVASVVAGTSSTVAIGTAGTGTTNLVVSGAPAGISPSLDLTSVSAGGGTLLHLVTTKQTAPGRYSVVVTGTQNAIAHATFVDLTVTAAPPDPPTSVHGTPANGAVKVAWTAPAFTGGLPITGYTVRASPGAATCATSVLTCTVPGLANGHPYTFRVTAHTASLTSVSSAPSPAIVPRTVPGTPRAPTAVPLNGAASLTWVAPISNGGSAIITYAVVASPGGRACTAAGSVLHCTVTGLTNGVSYRFSVKAVNAAGSGAASPLTSAIVAGSPSAPRALAVTAPANGKATATWTSPASVGSGPITSYQVRWSSNSGVTWTPWTSTGLVRSAPRSPLTKGHRYHVQTRAVNHAGAGPAASISFVQPR